jgi:6-phosphofructokinase 1
MESKVRNIAVLTSGGDASGMNACVRAVVRTALYHNLNVYGVFDGFLGLVKDDIKKMGYKDVSNILQSGGTILGTARCQEFFKAAFREKAFNNLKSRSIDGLIIIGGDGSFKGATIFSNEFNFPVIGIPATIDNDINGTEYTLGFDTALNTIVNALDNIRDTASSHHRIFLIEVMGNKSGLLAMYSAIASGAREVFMPEKTEDLLDIKQKITKAMSMNRSSMIIVSEGDEMGGVKEVYDYLFDQNLADKIRMSVLGHIQRGGRPSFLDRFNAAIFGEAAVSELIKGNSQMMIGIQDGQLKVQNLSISQESSPAIQMDYLKLIRKLSSY